MKAKTRWFSHRVQRETTLVRWGHFGCPVLLFPTAGGDAEEIERMLMIKVLTPLIEGGRIKVYSVDSLAAQSWSDTSSSARHSTWLQNQFDGYIHREVVPAIREDCGSEDLEVVVAGASIGAFNALSTLCRHPDVFKTAVCLSGSYDVARFIRGHDGEPLRRMDPDYYVSSPLHFVPRLPEDGEQLRLLRQRFVVFAHGGGRWEDPGQDWGMARILGARGVPNRVDPWGPDFDHDWPTWRHMMPKYLSEVC